MAKTPSINNAKVTRNIDGAFSYQQSTYFFVNKFLFLQKNSHILSNSIHFQKTASRKLALTERTVSLRHRGGRIQKINAWYLNTHMVYL